MMRLENLPNRPLSSQVRTYPVLVSSQTATELKGLVSAACGPLSWSSYLAINISVDNRFNQLTQQVYLYMTDERQFMEQWVGCLTQAVATVVRYKSTNSSSVILIARFSLFSGKRPVSHFKHSRSGWPREVLVLAKRFDWHMTDKSAKLPSCTTDNVE